MDYEILYLNFIFNLTEGGKMIPILLIILIIVFNSQMDVIQFHPQDAWFKGWWVEKKQLHKSFWQGTVFNMFSNGWHFCKFLMRICEIALFYFCLELNMPFILAGIFILIIYGLTGLLFEFLYRKGL